MAKTKGKRKEGKGKRKEGYEGQCEEGCEGEEAEG